MMKRFSIIMMCVATMTLGLVSCGSASSLTSSNPAMDNGKSAANALVALYNSYKSNGSISLTNPTDLSNSLILATQYSQMRANKDNTDYMKSFASGMVAAGSGLITSDNVNSIITKMNSVTGLNVNATNIANNVATVNSIVQLVKMLK